MLLNYGKLIAITSIHFSQVGDLVVQPLHYFLQLTEFPLHLKGILAVAPLDQRIASE